ncbi:malto-oligosyltrehalose synthase [Dyadobacter arcticus]|uniref:4-alpha-glucanotransferase n=1 Tax=Dyadobacter arcticus TaxID=1078754 RepID=A0ABX0UL78_9BACT|nr:malto-oligosyltrehalose synthase [Dyadobacter arcticus]NIJ53632.1 malto-oligosyltrehalose synthase/4-alpha-glucanotransferase [Dyadobacter arcticus]
MSNPVSTYRLQFSQAFSFKDFEKLIPYYQKLGIGTIYASPILASVPGSTHGYDGVNPGLIDPELGTLEDLKRIHGKLKQSEIGWLQDIVPNHMAFHSENPWLMDVLEKGTQSVYAAYFDIAWNSRLFHGKIMVPFLAHSLDEVIENGALKLAYKENRFVMEYEGSVYPLNLRSYLTLLSDNPENQSQSIHQLISQLRDIHEVEDSRVFSERWNEFLLQLTSLSKNEQIGQFLEETLDRFNADESMLRKVVDEQTYVLCHWQRTEGKINFRRFFTVNGLICLNMQDDQVFEEYHFLIKSLIEDGVFQGLRIDHIDGLFDPSAYLQKLRNLAGNETYIVAEKILEKNENLPVDWPIEGTTGYEFLAIVNNLFTNKAAEPIFSEYYEELTGDRKSIHDQLISKKSEILYDHMAGELDNLYQLFIELRLADPEFTSQLDLKKAIGEFLIHCPVYRYYGNSMPLSESEAPALKTIFEKIRHYHPDISAEADLLEKCLLSTEAEDTDYQSRVLEFYQRCMQFTGPIMAKGGEDTLMYTNNRFIGHNDVGDFPDRFGITSKDFHKFMQKRQKDWPLCLNATSTHDTKRGEDVRARLNALTDLGETWIEKVKEWKELNANSINNDAPDENDQYLIYQTLVGAYPMQGEDEDDFSKRLFEYLQKALREAKTKTSWSEPDEAYEQKVTDFAGKLLDQKSPFFKSFQSFQSEIVDFGIINSLSQLTLKFTCPGIPDVYQGCEFWDFSLVDPDNRRPVDYGKRQQALKDFEDYEPERLLEKLWKGRKNGHVKLWLTRVLFQLRKSNPVLFSKGDYIPLKTRGEYKDHLIAFARKLKRDFYVVVIPLHTSVLCKQQGKTFFELDWADTTVVLPDNLSPEFKSVITDQVNEFQSKLLPKEIFSDLPLAIFKGSKADNERKAGVLLHITSLASPYGIGDMGPEAFVFADFLERGSQKFWQILPLNPTEEAQSNSPYSALSSRAGNPSLISPDLLASDGLLSPELLGNYHEEPTAQIDFTKAEKIKSELLEEAYKNRSADPDDENAFKAFCDENAEWLGDFSLYIVLKKRHDGNPWYEWPDQFKLRDVQALKETTESESESIQYVQWQQYIFDKQWKNLKSYCNALDIKLLGDIPFYISYDSADVWANRELFCVDETGKITGIAGVPPDSFSDDGQLWGMPVFNWEALKAQGYQWWIDRLAKNIELFDLVRLDHFRAFADYWEVPGGETTAVNGAWKLGPGEDFFKKIELALGHLPFIAEDLGEISPEVYKLRDRFALPGMKVLQFAFDENMPQSDHIPHNYSANFIAYTGTHDNNTVKGWFRETASDGVKSQFENYIGKRVQEDDVHIEMARLVYGSIAKTAILPMQDILNLDETAKMNLPGSNDNNWAWRLLPGQVSKENQQFLADLAVLYNRD